MSRDFDARATLCKATLAIVKLLPPLPEKTYEVYFDGWRKPYDVDADLWWKHVSDFSTYAHLIEQDKGTLGDALVDEVQRVIASSCFSEFSERLVSRSR